MKKRILSLILILSLALPFGIIHIQAAGLDPYVGFNATLLDEYQCARPANFSANPENGYVGGIWVGDWVCYKGVNFGDVAPTAVEVSVGVPKGYATAVEIRADAPDSKLLATVPITPSAWREPVTTRVELDYAITGVHDLYITYSKSTANIFDIQFFKPKEAGSGIPEFDDTDAYNDIADDKNNHAINVLYQLGILRDYEDGAFDPNLPVTRGEFLYSVYKVYGKADVEGPVTTRFSDVDPEKYYAAAIVYLSDMGIVNGTGDATFSPDDFIRHVDALAIICRVLDWEVLAKEYGGYPTGYIRIASDEKFFVKDIGNYDYLRRTDMANMLYNAINAEALTVTGIKNHDTTYGKTQGMLYKTQDIYNSYGKVSTNYITSLRVHGSNLDKKEVLINGVVYKTGLTNAVSMLGVDCEFYYVENNDNTKTLRAIIPMASVNVTKISANNDAIESIANDLIVYTNENGKRIKFKIDSTTAVLYNGVAIDDTIENMVGSISDFCGDITFIENGSGENTVIIDDYVNYEVSSINRNDKYIRADDSSNTQISVDEEENIVFFMKEGESAALSDLSEGDLVSIFASKNSSGKKYIRVYINSEKITGTIESLNSNSGVVISGEEYKLSPNITFTPEINDSGIFKLDVRGYIAAYEYSDISSKKVGLYLACAVNNQGLNSAAEVKLVANEGEPTVFKFADKVTIDGIKYTDVNTIINGNLTWYGITYLTPETPVVYTVNSDNEINWMDTTLYGSNDDKDTLKCLTSGSNITYNWRNGVMAEEVSVSGTIYSVAKYYMPKTATLIAFFADSDDNDDNWTISQVGSNFNNDAMPKGEVYSTLGDDYNADLFIWRNSETSTSYTTPFVYTGKTSAIDEKGDTYYNVQGYSGMSKVTYKLTQEALNGGYLAQTLPGDFISVRLNAAKEISNVRYIAFRDGASARNGVSAMVSDSQGIVSGPHSNRNLRYVYGTVAEKGKEYIAIDLGGTLDIGGTPQTVTEIVERTSADVVVVDSDGRGGQYAFDIGLDSQNINVGDTVSAYISNGSARIIVVYK